MHAIEATCRQPGIHIAPARCLGDPPWPGQLEVERSSSFQDAGRGIQRRRVRSLRHHQVVGRIGGMKLGWCRDAQHAGELPKGIHERRIGRCETGHAVELRVGKQKAPVEAPDRVKLGLHGRRQGTTLLERIGMVRPLDDPSMLTDRPDPKLEIPLKVQRWISRPTGWCSGAGR